MGSRTTPIPANPPSSWAAFAPPVISLCALLSALSRPCSSLPCTQVLSHDSKVLAAATCSAGKATHGAAAEPVIPHVSEANPDARSLCHRPWRPSLCQPAASPRFCLPVRPLFSLNLRHRIVARDSNTSGSSQVFRRKSDVRSGCWTLPPVPIPLFPSPRTLT